MESQHLVADISQKALIVRDGKVLLVWDNKTRWELPGGRLHKDEQPLDGLRRELIEELGLEVEPGDVAYTFVFVSESSGMAHFVVVYACQSRTAIDDMKIDPKEVGGVRWVGLDDFETLSMRDGYKEALRKFFRK